MVLALCGWIAASFAAVAALAARRSLAVRKEAVVRACHELRGPLTAARLGLQLSVRLGELSRTRLRAIDLELSRAALALDDLARVRPPGCAQRRWEEVDVGELLSDSAEAWRGAAADRRAELQVKWTAAPARIWAERARLAQAVGNLIANAIEHAGGEVLVRGRVTGRAVRIEVIDRGPGLPAPVADIARRARGGRGQRGRGLAIASAVAEDHGGRLAAAPAEQGARLVLELPLSAGQRVAEDRR